MIPNVANSTSIMHAKRRPSLQWLNLTTSRSVDAIAGRCGGREAWTTPPCKGYLRYTDPGAPTSCGVHARRRHSAEKHTKWCMCGDHCQLPSYDNRGQSIRETGGDEGKETEKDFSFSPLFFFSRTCPARVPIITVSVRLDPLSASNFSQRAQQHVHHLSTNARRLPRL